MIQNITKHDKGSAIAWACMAVNGTESLVFIYYNDVSADTSR